jgi:hypothetical protein
VQECDFIHRLGIGKVSEESGRGREGLRAVCAIFQTMGTTRPDLIELETGPIVLHE